MKKLLSIALALLLPSGAMAQTCLGTDVACFRTPGSLAPEAKIDSLGVPTFSGLASCDTIDTDANGVASCGTDGGGGGGGHVIQVSTDGIIGTELTTESTRANLAFGPSFTLKDDAGKDANIVTFSGTNGVIQWNCPSGFTKIESQGAFLGCMQNTEEGSDQWYDASDDCFDTYGGRLPLLTELYIAFNNYGLTDETDDIELVSDSAHATQQRITGLGSGGISNVSIPLITDATAYRCFIPKPDHTVTAGSAISVPASETTYLPGTTVADAGSMVWVDVPGAEVTIETNGGTLDIFVTGVFYNTDGGDQWACANIQVDGVTVGGYTDNASDRPTGAVHCGTDNGQTVYSATIAMSDIVVTAGSHDITVRMWSNASGNAVRNLRMTAVERRNVAGTGDVATNGNNTFTGVNTFNGPVQFNDSTGVGSEGWVVQEKISGTNTAPITFSNLDPNKQYKLVGTGFPTLGTGLRMRFNGDSSANYSYLNEATCNNGNGATSSTTSGSIVLNNASNNAKDSMIIDAFIGTTGDTSDRAIFMTGVTGSRNVDPNACRGEVSGFLDTEAGLTSISIHNSALDTGNIVGEFTLMKIAPIAVGSAISVPASDFTTIAGGDLSQTSMGPCIAGSTVTVVTAGSSAVDVVFNGSVHHNGTVNEYAVGFLFDGDYVDGMGPTRGVHTFNSVSQSDARNGSFSYRVSNINAGTHTACLTGSANVGSIRFVGTTQKLAYTNAYDGNAQFGITEVRNVAGTGDVASNGNNTYTGKNEYAEGATLNSSISRNGVSNGGLQYNAKNQTGASLAVGCMGTLRMSSLTSATADLEFIYWPSGNNDTKANSDHGASAVLTESCGIGATCNFQVSGPAYVQADATGIANGYAVGMSATDCRGVQNGATSNYGISVGHVMGGGAVGANAWFWMWLIGG